jgi:hypothetical protein
MMMEIVRPEPPGFDSFEAQSLHIRQRPAAAARKLHIVSRRDGMLTQPDTPYGGWMAFQPLCMRILKQSSQTCSIERDVQPSREIKKACRNSQHALLAEASRSADLERHEHPV